MSFSKGAKPAPPGPPGGVGGQERLREGKNPFEDLVWIAAVNKKHNDNIAKCECYQVNPYFPPPRILDFVTPKITECGCRITDVCPRPIPECIFGYDKLRKRIQNYYALPQDKYCEPQTESMRLGWFDKGQGYYDRENYDDRFKFSHQTAEFIRVHAEIKEHDRLMNLVPAMGVSESIAARNAANPWRI